MIGYAERAPNRLDGWQWSNGLTSVLEKPAPSGGFAGSITPLAINNAGVVAGKVWDGDGTGQPQTFARDDAVVWRNGALTRLETVYGHGAAADVNDAGTVVGYTPVASGGTVAALWRDGGLELLDRSEAPAPGHWSSAQAINQRGQVVGYGNIASPYEQGLRWDANGTMSVLAGLDFSKDVLASDINESGLIVGTTLVYDPLSFADSYTAVMWDEKGQVLDLNSLLDEATRQAGWVLQHASGINDNGWIIGQAWNTVTRQSSAYLLTMPIAAPVPDAPTALLALAGLGIVAVARRRQRN